MQLKTLVKELVDVLPKDRPIRIGLRPSPTGVMTLGNMKGAVLLDDLVKALRREGLNALLVLRFDDTNPEEKYDAWNYVSFVYYCNKFGISFDEVTFCSDYIKRREYETQIDRLLETQNAFVCVCPPMKLRQESKCVCSEDEELQRKRSRDLENETVKRHFKCSNTTQVLYRRIGEYYCPTLVFQGPVDDHRQGQNVIFRGRDLESIGIKQKQLYELLYEEPYPRTYYWGRITLWDSLSEKKWSLSKSLLKDNKQFPSLDSFFEYGYAPEVIRTWILSYNFTKNDIHWDLSKLNSFQRNWLKERKTKRISSFEQLKNYRGYFSFSLDREVKYGFKNDSPYLYQRQLMTALNQKDYEPTL